METSKKPVPNLLIVDDEESLTQLFADLFGGEGYRCHVAKDGLHALEVLRDQQPIHAILCDIQMPRLDGLQFLRQIRTQGDLTPFVFLTSDRRRESIVEALTLGAFDFIDKPFDLKKLISIVAAAIELGLQMKELNQLSLCNEREQRALPKDAIIQNQLLLMKALRFQNKRAS